MAEYSMITYAAFYVIVKQQMALIASALTPDHDRFASSIRKLVIAAIQHTAGQRPAHP
jgi:hypothetical protein